MVTADETFAEQVQRVTMMIADDGDTWDLGENDKAALRSLLRAYRQAVDVVRDVAGLSKLMIDPEVIDFKLIDAARAVVAKADGR